MTNDLKEVFYLNQWLLFIMFIVVTKLLYSKLQ